MKSLSNIKKKTQKLREQNKTIEIPAFLGDLEGNVKADNNNSVYVVLFNGEVQVVRNDKVPPIPRLPVIIGNDVKDSTLRVLRLRKSFSNPPYVNLPAHADKTHQWPQVDTLWVRPEQFLSGIAIPDGNSLIVQFIGFVYYLNGWHLLNTQPIDLTSYIPTSGANFVLVQVDVDKVISFVEGASKGSREMLEYEDIPIGTVGHKPLFAVKMYKGQTRIIKAKSTSDIVDLRFAGFASGGEATAIDWSDILSVPDVFPPDLTIADGVYPRYWLKSAPPTVDDDITAGYGKLHLWLDQSAGDAYLCIDNSNGAAVWQLYSSVGIGGFAFSVEGKLAVTDEATSPMVITADATISSWYMYLRTPGTSGATILDVILKRAGDADISIFDDGITDNRPSMVYSDADHLLVATPLITDFLAGDVLELGIAQVAAGSSDVVLSPVGSSSGGGGVGLTVTDGSTTVEHVGQITVEDNLHVIDDGGGQVRIVGGLIASITTVQTREQGDFICYNSGDGTVLTPLDIVFTPKKAGNKVILEWVFNGEAHWETGWLVSRNGVLLPNTTNIGNDRWAVIATSPYDTNNDSTPANIVVKIIDESSLDVESTYSLRVRSTAVAETNIKLNRTYTSAGADNYEALLSTGMAMEINT